MAYDGGPVVEINIGGINFAVDDESDVQWEHGGFVVEKKMNGNGTSRNIRTRKVGYLTGMAVAVSQSQTDIDLIQDFMDAGQDIPCSFTTSDGTTFGADGVPVQATPVSTKNATMELRIEVESRWQRQ